MKLDDKALWAIWFDEMQKHRLTALSGGAFHSGLSNAIRATVSRVRDAAYAEAAEVAEGLSCKEPRGFSESAYNCGIDNAAAHIRNLIPNKQE